MTAFRPRPSLRPRFATGLPVCYRYHLTERQKEVLMHILQGRSPQQIAASLHRSVHTINHFVRQLYDRFDVSSRGELMAVFIDKAVMRAAAAVQSAAPH